MIPPCLIILAHGSPDPRWRRPFEELEAALRRELGPGRVRLAYLQHAAPDPLEMAAQAVAGGCTHLRILPLFMAGGGHVDRDLTPLGKRIEARHPGVKVELLPPAGEHPQVAAALFAAALESALSPSE